MNEITLYNPFDAHLHLRQGDMLKQVAPLSAKTFAGAIIMPNTNPPVYTHREALEYRHNILNTNIGVDFDLYMTLYFNTDFTYYQLEEAKKYITAIKFYPKNLTHNSQYGCDPKDLRVHGVLKCMEELEIPLCVHAEAEGYHEDREILFHQTLRTWAGLYPKLKIIVEHISDASTLYLLRNYENMYGTITAHHSILTGDSFIGPPLRPHYYCMPVCKRPEDREALQEVVLKDNSIFKKLCFGSDSAPHDITKKECAEGCAGIFTAPICLQLLCELFFKGEYIHEVRLQRLQDFISGNACKIYNLTLPEKKVTLIKKDFQVPMQYDGLNRIIPLFANEILKWSINGR